MSITFTASVGLEPQTPRATFHEALEDLYMGIQGAKTLTAIFLEETCWISLNGFTARFELIMKFYACKDFAYKVGLVREDDPMKVHHEVGDPSMVLLQTVFANSMLCDGDPKDFIAALPPYSQAA